MSSDEIIVTIAAVVAGPMLWVWWLFAMSRVRPLRRRPGGIGSIALTLAACTMLIVFVVNTIASADVVDSVVYRFMYVVLGLAWARIAAAAFPYLGLSARDDAIERGNGAAGTAFAGALLGVTACYAGANVGNGPGWWVVVFSATLATAMLMSAWGCLAALTPVTDAVAIDRDPAAGLRLGAFLFSCGLVLGRGVAGDWASAAATVVDLAAALPAVAVLVALATVVERLARPTSERPRAPLVTLGIGPSILYFLVAVAAVRKMGWPS